MKVYLDTSVILRRLFGQVGSLKDWGHWPGACTSRITRVEGLRGIDRLRLQGRLSDAEVAQCVGGLADILDRLEQIELNEGILERAAQSFPTSVGTLDALHLASALLWQENFEQTLLFLTHDSQLGRAAQAVGLQANGF